MSTFFMRNLLIFAFLFYIAVISGVTRALSQGGKRAPLATVQGPLANTRKKREK